MVQGILLSMTRTASDVLDTVLTHLRLYHLYALDATVTGIAIWILLRWFRTSCQQLRTTQLRGPPNQSFLYGVDERIFDAEDSGAVYEAWAQEYGPVYTVPSTLGSTRVVLCDPKAIAHFYSRETRTYIQTPFVKETIAMFFGKGLVWAHGENHKRQRRSLTPAFSVAAIRRLTSVFYDSAYKAKGAWDVLIESNGGDSTTIEVQNWMNHISLDTIGLAGFSHNFGALEGKHSSISEVLDAFGTPPRTTALHKRLHLLAETFPFIARLPTPLARLRLKFNTTVEEISNGLLARTRKELEMGVVEGKEEKSIIGLLIKGANADSVFRLTKDEVTAQMKVLLLAGYETTSITLTWTLLELSRNPDVQTKLRNELIENGADPTYDQFTNGLPYLDAVVHEVLRLHPAVSELTRVAIEDDVIPLSEPVRTKSGELLDRVTIAKGTRLTISMRSVNRSAAIWGEDAKIFRPSRWLEDAQGQDGIPTKAKEIQGYRHLLTFVDGPRTCLGKNFAVTDLKAVLSVLVKNFVYQLRDGVDSKIEEGGGMLPRPYLAGELGCKVPLCVRPYGA